MSAPCPPPYYPIGTHKQPWGAEEKKQWFDANCTVKREYKVDVLVKLEALKSDFEVRQYGALSGQEERYPLYAVMSKVWDEKKPNVLITGGVHGYETSGVQGALLFLTSGAAKACEANYNLVVCPCLCPWGYETINRWTRICMDPNRYFVEDSVVEECQQLRSFVFSLGKKFNIHFDLHETTDTDASEFMPAKSARDGLETHSFEEIPDGFYVMGSAIKPQPEYLVALIDAVKKVTHIAPADAEGKVIGIPITSEGAVIDYENPTINACDEMLKAEFAVTTEVYPDSPKVDGENCNQAQVACVVAGLEYLLAKGIAPTLV